MDTVRPAKPPASRWWKPPAPAEPLPSVPVAEPNPAGDEAVAHLLREFPPGRSAVLLLCDPEPVDASPAVAAMAVAIASRVTGQVLAMDAAPSHVVASLRDANLGFASTEPQDTGLAALLAAKSDAARESRPRLADVLAGKATWRQAVCSTRLANLEMLPGPPHEDGTAEELSPPPADRWAAVLHPLRQHYQFVLIGVSPADCPMVPAIARWADATYLLIRPHETGQRAARQAVRALCQSGGRVLGCVLVEHAARGGRS